VERKGNSSYKNQHLYKVILSLKICSLFLLRMNISPENHIFIYECRTRQDRTFAVCGSQIPTQNVTQEQVVKQEQELPFQEDTCSRVKESKGWKMYHVLLKVVKIIVLFYCLCPRVQTTALLTFILTGMVALLPNTSERLIVFFRCSRGGPGVYIQTVWQQHASGHPAVLVR